MIKRHKSMPTKNFWAVYCLSQLPTRPDNSYAVSILCRYASNPKLVHCNQLKRILRYLSGTRTHALFFTSEKGALNAYCDADWAGERSDRKSTAGFVAFCGYKSCILAESETEVSGTVDYRGRVHGDEGSCQTYEMDEETFGRVWL